MALPIGLLEVIGGIALLVGVLTRIASILFIIEMIGSTITAKLSKGFVGGYELDLLLMAISISLLLTGPGRICIEWNVLILGTNETYLKNGWRRRYYAVTSAA
jgi:putative oxidoreductase